MDVVRYWDATANQFIEVTSTTPLPVTGGTGGGGSTTNPIIVKETGSTSYTANILNVATAGTRVQLPNVACAEVTIIAKDGNIGAIYVGSSNVSAATYGAKMVARDSITLRVGNANLVWIDAATSGEGISYNIT